MRLKKRRGGEGFFVETVLETVFGAGAFVLSARGKGTSRVRVCVVKGVA
jgi:hypothetical protein